MQVIGKKSPLVQLIKAKTKAKEQDILDILHALPECIGEAFLIENPEEKQLLNLGPFIMFWKKSNWGPTIKFKPTKAFRLAITTMKVEGKHPLAKKLYDLMPPINQKTATSGALNRKQNTATVKTNKR